MTSLPSSPAIVSFPARPWMKSSPGVPKIALPLLSPTMVAGRPLHRTGGGPVNFRMITPKVVAGPVLVTLEISASGSPDAAASMMTAPPAIATSALLDLKAGVAVRGCSSDSSAPGTRHARPGSPDPPGRGGLRGRGAAPEGRGTAQLDHALTRALGWERRVGRAEHDDRERQLEKGWGRVCIRLFIINLLRIQVDFISIAAATGHRSVQNRRLARGCNADRSMGLGDAAVLVPPLLARIAAERPCEPPPLHPGTTVLGGSRVSRTTTYTR